MEEVRLQKFLASSGVASRRKSEELILEGKVKVNGELWSAISDSNIEKDEKIKVISVNGVKLKVEKIHISSQAQ